MSSTEMKFELKLPLNKNVFQIDHNKNYNYFKKKLNDTREYIEEKDSERENMDKRDRRDLIEGGTFIPRINKEIIKDLENTLENSYFYFYCEDDGKFKYISSNITEYFPNTNKEILKYTSARRGYVKNNTDIGLYRTKIIVSKNKIVDIIEDKLEDTLVDINQKNIYKIKDEPNGKIKRIKTESLGDISAKMINEQDRAMRLDYNGVTLISGVAGSGKTNIILHRIDFLLSEYSKEFSQFGIAVFCYNVSLKKYLKDMLRLNFPNVNVYSKDKYFQNLCKDYLGYRYKTDKKLKGILNEKIVKKINIELGNNLTNYLLGKLKYINKYQEDKQTKTEHVIEISLNRNKILDFFGIGKENLIKDDFLFILYEVSKIIFTNKNNSGGFFTIDNDNIIIIDRNQIKYNESSNVSIKNYTFKKPSFDHIFIDEVQDRTPIEINILKKIQKKGITLAGDVSQLLFQNNIIKIEEVIGHIDRKIELTTTHRSGAMIVLFARQFIEKIQGTKSADKASIIGDKPKIYLIENLKTDKFIKLLQNVQGSTCIATPTKKSLETKEYGETISEHLIKNGIDTYFAKRDSRDFNKKIHVSNYLQIKGLEFNNVFVFYPDDFLKSEYNYLKNRNQILYTVFTRAKENLSLVIKDRKFLDNIKKDSYQLVTL